MAVLPGNIDKKQTSTYRRTFLLFRDLLESQFPIDNKHKRLPLRSTSDFASQLSLPVRQLDRAMIVASGKTAKQVINERILKESKNLLERSSYSVSEIAHVLGFSEVIRFKYFFQKYVHYSPYEFRNARSGISALQV